MNRFVEKLVQGTARLAFWRKPVEASPEQPQPPDPETASQAEPIEAEPSAAVDVPVPQAGWLARLKHALRWRRNPAQELPPEPVPEQTMAMAPASQEPVEASATADDVPPPTLSLLARLKNTFRRQPRPEPLEADTDALKPSAENNKRATASSEAIPADDADATQASRIRRVLALLSNKWVWIPGVSGLLLAVMIAMMLMLLRSAQEKEQLQAKLVATQTKLKQTTLKIQDAARRQAGDPANVKVASAADTRPGVDAGDCVVSDKESVIRNLKNCIEGFNRATAR